MAYNLRKILSCFSNNKPEVYRNIIRQEGVIGGQLFGAVSSGSRREFFCLDEDTWIWHEERKDDSGHVHSLMTRYDIHTNGVSKAQGNRPDCYINATEALRLYDAVNTYNLVIDTKQFVVKK